MEEKGTWFDELERKGVYLTEEQRRKIESKMSSILSYEPRIGILGKTGVGKSSLCNALFGQELCKVNDVEACTRDPQEVFLNIGTKGIKLLDVPGVGENLERDKEYEKLYAKLLPELDLVLWLVKADDRAMASDEQFFKKLVKPHLEQGKPFFFVVNQIDKISPEDWDAEKNEPSPEQAQNIIRKTNALANQFSFQASKIISVSARRGYNLVRLVDEIVYALPKEKTITFFKAVDDAVKSEAAGEHVKKNFLEVVGEVIQDVVIHAEILAANVSEVVGKVTTFLSGIMPTKPWWWPF